MVFGVPAGVPSGVAQFFRFLSCISGGNAADSGICTVNSVSRLSVDWVLEMK